VRGARIESANIVLATGSLTWSAGTRAIDGSARLSSWLPAVEVTERGNTLVVRADLPGINQDDLKVEVTPDGLTIQGERKREHEERGAWGYRSERSYGSFYRTIPLPEGASVDGAKAAFKDGVLEVFL